MLFTLCLLTNDYQMLGSRPAFLSHRCAVLFPDNNLRGKLSRGLQNLSSAPGSLLNLMAELSGGQ